jgi:hypothetical protein
MGELWFGYERVNILAVQQEQGSRREPRSDQEHVGLVGIAIALRYAPRTSCDIVNTDRGCPDNGGSYRIPWRHSPDTPVYDYSRYSAQKSWSANNWPTSRFRWIVLSSFARNIPHPRWSRLRSHTHAVRGWIRGPRQKMHPGDPHVRSTSLRVATRRRHSDVKALKPGMLRL